MILEAVVQGITCFDCARTYAGSESYYGQVLSKHPEDRAHGAHNGKTPMDRYFDESSKTPFRDEVEAMYDPSKEHFRAQNYQSDRKLKKPRDS